jgi:DNA-binding IclR family transcriptional regulator
MPRKRVDSLEHLENRLLRALADNPEGLTLSQISAKVTANKTGRVKEMVESLLTRGRVTTEQVTRSRKIRYRVTVVKLVAQEGA